MLKDYINTEPPEIALRYADRVHLYRAWVHAMACWQGTSVQSLRMRYSMLHTVWRRAMACGKGRCIPNLTLFLRCVIPINVRIKTCVTE
jgi:hypothetical protein